MAAVRALKGAFGRSRARALPPDRLGLALLAGLLVASAGLMLWLLRDLAFVFDEHLWLESAAIESPGELLEPRNGHLMIFPFAVFKMVLELFGAEYDGFKAAGLVAVLACGALVWVYGRSRVGPLLALAPATVVLFFGSGWVMYLVPMIGFQVLSSLALGLAALIAAQRSDRRGDVAACVLLCLSVASFSDGVAFLAAVAVQLAIGRDRRSRAWVVAVPLVLYIVWRLWATQFGGTGAEPVNALLFPAYVVDSLAAVVAATFGRVEWVGLGPATGFFIVDASLENAAAAVVLVGLEVAAITLIIRALLRRGLINRSLLPPLVALLTLWALQGSVLSEGRQPGTGRYLYPGVFMVLLVAIEAARGFRPSRKAFAVLAVLAVLAVVGNLPQFQQGRYGLKNYALLARSTFAAIEVAGSNANPAYSPAADLRGAAGVPVAAGRYLEVVDKYGSPGFTVEELAAQSPENRLQADRVLIEALGLRLEPTAEIPAQAPAGVALPPAGPDDDHCVTRIPGSEFRLLDGGAEITSSAAATLALRRFADSPTMIGRLVAGVPSTLRLPADEVPAPWLAQVSGASGPVALMICNP